MWFWPSLGLGPAIAWAFGMFGAETTVGVVAAHAMGQAWLS